MVLGKPECPAHVGQCSSEVADHLGATVNNPPDYVAAVCLTAQSPADLASQEVRGMSAGTGVPGSPTLGIVCSAFNPWGL